MVFFGDFDDSPSKYTFIQPIRRACERHTYDAASRRRSLYVDVYECVTCAGLTPVGRKLCSFEGGLIAGVMESIVKKPVTATEVTCIGGLGHKTCGFDVQIGETTKLRAV